jgi:hypothetical protein
LARFWRGTGVITTPNFAGETRLIAAAMLAMPLIQKLAQGLETRVENGLAAFFAPTPPAATGQNVPSAAPASSAISAQTTASATSSAAATLLNLQNDAAQARHHHGAGRYKAAASAASDLITQAGRGATTAASVTA